MSEEILHSNGTARPVAATAPPDVTGIAGGNEARSSGAPNEAPPPAVEAEDAGTATSPVRVLEDAFKRLGGLRDGLLVFGGVVYLLGRLVWAYHAHRFNLGILSVEQSQYFVAGFIPALLVALALLVTYGIRSVLQAIGSRVFAPDPSPRRRMLRKILTVLYWADGGAALLIWSLKGHLRLTSATYAVLLFTTFCVFAAGVPLLLRVWENRANEPIILRPSEWLMAAIYPLLVAGVFICVYGEFEYPHLAQDYGGALPRVAALDLDRSKVSPETLRELVPGRTARSNSPVVRTEPLDIFFASKDVLLVKPYRRWSDNRTYELAASSVLGRTWDDPEGYRP